MRLPGNFTRGRDPTIMAPWHAWQPELHRGEALIFRLLLLLTVASQAPGQIAEYQLRIDPEDRQTLHVQAMIPAGNRFSIGYGRPHTRARSPQGRLSIGDCCWHPGVAVQRRDSHR